MRPFRLALFIVLLHTSAFAVQPQFWKVDSTDDFLSGEIDGFAVSARGELLPGPAAKKLAAIADPFVLSQVTAPDGSVYLGTGNEGRVYRLLGDQLELFFDAAEPEVYALAQAGGHLFVGTSPRGKIYRVRLSDGVSEEWFDPDQAYIWALEPGHGNAVFAATGLGARLIRISSKGVGELWFEAPEAHLRSLAIRPDGVLLAGGSGEGRIYEISGPSRARALFDSDLSEIAAVAHDPVSGITWAAGVTSILPTTPPASSQSGQQGTSQRGSESSSQQKSEGEPQPSVEVSFSFDQSAAMGEFKGKSELYRIAGDGYVDLVARLDRDIIYGLGEPSASGVFIATGSSGRLYRFEDRHLALAAAVPDKQIVSIGSGKAGRILTTTNSAGVYLLSERSAETASFRSGVKDATRFSTFGHYRLEGSRLDGSNLTVSFRSGNTSTPDDTWSGWSASRGVSGSVTAPAARYLQWRIEASSVPESLRIDSVTVAYLNRNAPPVIESVMVHDPGAVFITGNYPSPPGVIEATSPDEYGIFTSLDNPTSRSDPGKRYFRKGFQTLSWRARDPNGDSLRFGVFFRREGEANWLRLRENLQDSQINFDTSQLPNGRYEVRIIATDEPGNPNDPSTDTREDVFFLVDNGLPSIENRLEGDHVVIRVRDALSPIRSVEFSVDAEKWVPLIPDDGIADSMDETFRLRRQDIEGRFVVVRAVDAHFNAATVSISVK